MQFLVALAAKMLQWLLSVGYAALAKFLAIKKEQKAEHEKTKQVMDKNAAATTPQERADAADGVINNI